MKTLPFPIAILLLAPAASRAQSRVVYSHSAAPVIRAAHLTGQIRIDGRLDEPAWALAAPVTSFTQLTPDEGRPASQRTEVRILIGADALYVGAHLFESDTSAIRPRISRRDDPVDGDVFTVTIDSRHDHVSAYLFRVTAGGAVRDAVVRPDNSLDLSWDAVWEAKVSRDATGWYVEMRIPLSQLPYTRGSNAAEWGIQFYRFRWNRFEDDRWAFTPSSEQDGINRFGHLLGLGALPASRELELTPYVSSRATYARTAPGDPFHSGDDYTANVGADLKYRVTSGLTLNATVNPDFGQVEVDPTVINLTQFETFFPEKRPFFVEGQQLFQFGSIATFNSFAFPTLFFSRRIGRAPHLTLADPGYAFVDAPDQTAIAAAAKLTGKTAGGWDVATLDAVTTREEARVEDTLGLRGRRAVEPRSNYFVTRVQRELNAGNTLVGGLVTAVNRDGSDPTLDALLRRSAYSGGVDFVQRWQNRSWELDASLMASRVAGSDSAIALTQRASARYYDRPDATSFRFDPSRGTLGGHAAEVALTKLAGTHWIGNLAWQDVSPGFEVNDIGFETNADRRALSTDLAYQVTRPGRVFRNWNVAAFTNQTWNYDGDIVFNNYASALFAQFVNTSGVNARVDVSQSAMDDRLTRGGPLALQPRATRWQVGYFSDQRKHIVAQLTYTYGRDDAGGWSATYQAQVDYRPAQGLHIGFGPELDRSRNMAQFVASSADPTATRTYGVRYVFSTLEFTQVALVTRIDWTFTPALSLQAYVQPLVGAGNYLDFKELRAPRTFDFGVYGRDLGKVTRGGGLVTIDPDTTSAVSHQIVFGDPDFDSRTLVGNAVLRWEYRPGSALYLVWTQRRNGFEPTGNFSFSRDYRAIFSLRPENVFAVKASWWLSW